MKASAKKSTAAKAVKAAAAKKTTAKRAQKAELSAAVKKLMESMRGVATSEQITLAKKHAKAQDARLAKQGKAPVTPRYHMGNVKEAEKILVGELGELKAKFVCYAPESNRITIWDVSFKEKGQDSYMHLGHIAKECKETSASFLQRCLDTFCNVAE